MTKRLECYTRTAKAKALFRGFFDSDEDFLAFNLKHSVKVDNHSIRASVRVLDDNNNLQTYEGKPALVQHDCAVWFQDKLPYLTLNLSSNTEHQLLEMKFIQKQQAGDFLKGWAKFIGNNIKFKAPENAKA